MGVIWERIDKPLDVSVGRCCDICGVEELSDRPAILFDHGSDYKWIRVQLCLNDYTDTNNNRWFYYCSPSCYVEAIRRSSSQHTHESDCLGGIPVKYLQQIWKI